MEIFLNEETNKGYVVAKEDSKRAGMMSYSIARPKLIIIDHTDVEPEFNGKGIGKQMLYKIVELARTKDMKILPLCPFAAKMFKKLDDIKDVLKS